VAVIVDGLRDAAPDDRAIWPGFAADQVSELIWDRPALHATRAGAGWQLGAAAGRTVPADPDAIGEVLAALRGGRWHRLGDAVAVQATLTVVMGAGGGERRVIGFGAPIEGTEQRWIVVDGRGMIVDRWVVRALARDELSLRVRRPLAQLRPGARISLTIPPASAARAPDDSLPYGDGSVELIVEGQPWRYTGPPERHTSAPRVALLAPEAVAPLEQALRALTIVRIPDSQHLGEDAPAGLHIGLSAPAYDAALAGICRGAPPAERARLRALVSSSGNGCVEDAAADAIMQAAGGLLRPLGEIVERRPVPFAPASIVLADGATLTLSPPRIDGAAADPARVAELLAALAAPAGPVVPAPDQPAASWAPLGQLRVRSAAGVELSVELLPGKRVRRSGESLALAPREAAWTALSRPSRALREIATWHEQPTAISALQIDGVIYRRGATIGAWTREPANAAGNDNTNAKSVIGNAPATATPAAEVLDAVRAAAVEALAAELAAPTVIGPIDGPISAVHRVAITVAPPVGGPVTHILEIAVPISARCPAKIADETIALPAGTCTQIAPLAR
jgi:hypothetical protein